MGKWRCAENMAQLCCFKSNSLEPAAAVILCIQGICWDYLGWKKRQEELQALRDSNAGHDHHTTEIQRIFNGFYICKHSICLSDHKGFLQSALQQQEVVKKLLRSKYRIQCRAQQEKAEKTLKDQLEKWIDSKHHLVFTHLSPPIPWSPPITWSLNACCWHWKPICTTFTALPLSECFPCWHNADQRSIWQQSCRRWRAEQFCWGCVACCSKKKGYMQRLRCCLGDKYKSLELKWNFQTCKHIDEVRFLSKCLWSKNCITKYWGQ